MNHYDYFMSEALVLAQRAFTVGEFPVGCVVVYNNKIVAEGSRSGTTEKFPNEIDHAEMTALRRLSMRQIEGDPGKMALFCTLEPCLMCFGAILLSGIGTLVYAYEDVMGGGTRCDLKALSPLYRERTITIVPNILRKKSLSLLKAFFSNSQNTYWRESLLARYTLAQ